MTDKKAEIFNLFKEAENHNTPVRKERRISPRYLFIVLALFAVVVIVAVLAYMGVKKDLRGLQQTRNQKVSETLLRAEELEGVKKYGAALEMYLSVLGIDASQDKEIERAVKRLDDKIQHIREVRAYQGKIQIRDVKIRKDKNELKVSGNIVNRGKRPMNEIELTIYCLDEVQKPVCEEKLTAVSSDLKPLSRFQQRTFHFLRTYDKRGFTLSIPVDPALIEEVQVVVTDIAFAGQ